MATRKKLENTVQEEEGEQEQPELSKEEKAELFKRFAAADTEWEKAQEKVAELAKKRSEVVKEIAKKAGKGPFRFKGDVLNVIKRGDTYFFRGKKKEQKIEEIG